MNELSKLIEWLNGKGIAVDLSNSDLRMKRLRFELAGCKHSVIFGEGSYGYEAGLLEMYIPSDWDNPIGWLSADEIIDILHGEDEYEYEMKRCAGCKHSGVEDLFAEWMCKLYNRYGIDAYEDGCEKWEDDREVKMKAMISQPMAGRTEKEIAETREKAKAFLVSKGYEFVNTKFDDEWYSVEEMKKRGVENIPLAFLAKSLESMSKCDTVYFCDGWATARGCLVEHKAAFFYDLDIIYENEEDGKIFKIMTPEEVLEDIKECWGVRANVDK